MRNQTVLLITPWEREGGIATYSRYISSELDSLVDIKVYPWDYESFILRGLGLELFKYSFLKSLLDADTVHIQYTFGRYVLSTLPLVFLSKMFGCNLVITQHERFDNLIFEELIHYYHQVIYFGFDSVIVHTKTRKEIVWSGHHDKVEVIPHGVICRDSCKIVPDAIEEIVIPGMVRPNKRHDNLIKSLEYLPARIEIQMVGRKDSMSFPLIGDLIGNGYFSEIECLVNSSSISNRVEWCQEFVSEDDLFHIIDSADLIVLPYDSSSAMSGIIAHCVSFKTPVLVTGSETFRDVFSEDEVFLDGNSPKEIASSVMRAQDQVVRQKIINELSEKSIEYSWREIANCTAKTYSC
ncbi:glycosyltransferase [Halorubrum sp. RMP-47]|uniref:glycosyltransferase n=1 Tax=Halorubrum miltondacostae TaxID=3076378 RepID=UPI003528D6BD